MRPMTVGKQPAFVDSSMPISGFLGEVTTPADHILYTADGAMLYQVPVQDGDDGTPMYRDPGMSGGGVYRAGRP